MIKLTKEEIRDYLKQYYQVYSLEQLKTKLLEHGAELKDIEEEIKILKDKTNYSTTNFSKDFNSIQTNKNKILPLDSINSYEKPKTSLSTKISLFLTLTAILFFGLILFFPDDVASLVLSDSLESSSYFILDNSQINIQEQTITLHLKYNSDLNAQISSQDTRNFITLNSNGQSQQQNCDLNQIFFAGNIIEDTIILQREFVYIFEFNCENLNLNQKILLGGLNINLYDTLISTNLHLRDMPFRIINR